MARKCTPLCPYFKCLKNALIIKNINGKKVAWCTWVNDYCKGYKCNYAACKIHALMPDGTCALTVPKRRRKSIEEEALENDELSKIEKKLKKKINKKFQDFY